MVFNGSWFMAPGTCIKTIVLFTFGTKVPVKNLYFHNVLGQVTVNNLFFSNFGTRPRSKHYVSLSFEKKSKSKACSSLCLGARPKSKAWFSVGFGARSRSQDCFSPSCGMRSLQSVFVSMCGNRVLVKFLFFLKLWSKVLVHAWNLPGSVSVKNGRTRTEWYLMVHAAWLMTLA